MDLGSHILIIIITLFFSAFFSGVEIAYITSNKLHFELLNKQGHVTGKLIARFTNKPSMFLGATLIGNTIALVMYGIFMAALLEPFLENVLPAALNTYTTIVISQTIISTIIVLATAEFMPKSFFLINPDRWIEILALPILLVYYLLYPLVYVIVSVSKFIITKILKLEYTEAQPVFGLTDLNNYIKKNVVVKDENNEPEVDTKIFNRALKFKNLRVRDCMIPRTEIVAIDIEDGIEGIKKAFCETQHSKILVYKKTIDNITGYCHQVELFKKPKEISEIINPISIVPETMLAYNLMVQLIEEHKSLVLVVDEFGGTSGLVSIEDIIEEIFGEIRDEHDEEDLADLQLDPYNYLLSARHEIDYLNEKYKFKIPEGDYDTLGGFILSVNEDFPQENEIIHVPPYTFTIISLSGARIDKVKLTLNKEPETKKSTL
ncbi:hemolysin family protein [Cytophagaceae bacterium ABcell3]|nr:hemolysin family protein [Cytophagaceae bacterium ABcell3]